ncbi:uncharacterized protein G2W53_014133 [Senna tora]|uniref:Uncharacterized protein n=1 Tax=Senna tora TaxID=362788 RepID=A0A834WSZ5_9FABA|nr:uncharacterized protein G2W53_014133 [Senna tora]
MEAKEPCKLNTSVRRHSLVVDVSGASSSHTLAADFSDDDDFLSQRQCRRRLPLSYVF